jgi:redox-sensing transcriptional repressor
MYVQNKLQDKIPKPAISRLCSLYRALDDMIQSGVETVSSAQLGDRLSMNSHNVRKDISYLGDIGSLGAGYNVLKLKKTIAAFLGFDRSRNACVVGLGRLGTSILNFAHFRAKGYEMVAGFDSNINKIETMRTAVLLFPSYMIEEIVKRFEIELAIITVPEEAAQKVTDQLVEGGIKGIVNFTPTMINPHRPDVFVSHLSITGHFNYLSALITLNENKSS